ncbi:tetratricopeptide repeat protein, partial [Gemmatimonadota bacterium]
DEPEYYESCVQLTGWFSELGRAFVSGNWGEPFRRGTIEHYWDFSRIARVSGIHPSFHLLSGSVTLALTRQWLGAVGAYKLAAALMFSLLTALLFITVARRYGVCAGLWAAGAFALMPRVFGHAHIGATDMPITLLWFASAISFHRAAESRRWAPVFALVYGLALSAKFTALVILMPLAAYVLLRRRFRQAAWPVGFALVLSTLVMLGLNPLWWQDPAHRLFSFITENLTRSQWIRIPTFYLGRKYTFYLPWHHSLVYTLFTVSPLVLAGFLYGFWRTVLKPREDPWAGHMLIHWLAMHLVMLLPGSPGHDGVRLFLPSFAFLAAISAVGFHHFIREVQARLAGRPAWPKNAVAWLLLCVMLIPSGITLARVHPYELCYYNSLAGGIAGAQKLGMETTYWLDVINYDACGIINESVPDSAVVYTRGNRLFRFLQRNGRIKPSIRFQNEGYGFLLTDSRQSMFQEYDWLLWRKGKPLAEMEKDGVRLFAVFKVPEAFEEVLARTADSDSIAILYDRAVVYRQLGRLDSSYSSMEKYLVHVPDDYRAAMLMVSLCLSMKLPRKALEYLERFGESPDDPYYWHLSKGMAYYQMGKNEEAIRSFLETMKYKKFDYSTRAYLGNILYSSGKLEQAAEHYELMLSYLPYDRRALHMLGRINQVLKRPVIAKHYYERRLELDPGHPATLVNLGLLEQNQDRFGLAEEYFLQALRGDSSDISANYNIARLYAETGEPKLAEKYYRLLLRYYPDDNMTHMALAMLY